MEQSKLPVPPTPVPDDSYLALKLWNIMSGIDWDALPLLCELYGVEDLELLIAQLVAIREHGNG